MELLKSEKQRTEKASMIYNWLRTPPRHICEFRYGSPCLRQTGEEAGTHPCCLSTDQAGHQRYMSVSGRNMEPFYAWYPFKHSTTVSLLGCYGAMSCFAGWTSDCKDFCALGKTYSSAPHCCSAWILSIDYWVQILFFFYSILFSKFSSSQKSHKIWRCGLEKEMILPITYAMVSPEPHRAPTTTVMTADTRICSRNGLR